MSGLFVNLLNFLRTLVPAMITAALAIGCASSFAQSRYGLSEDASAVFNRWLRSSCIADEERALTDALLLYRASLAPAFEKAVADGPPEDELSRARAAAEERYAERSKFPLEEYRIEGVNKEDLARWKRVSGQEYIDDQVHRFALGYRSNALAGLGVVDGPGSRAFLARIAADKSNPLAAAAAEALRTMRPQ